MVMMLSEHPGWTYSVSQLSHDTEVGDYSPESVSVLVARLRKKFAAVGATDVIETVRGIGYRLHGSPAKCDVEAPPDAGPDREMRDALWQLQESVIEVERVGDVAHEREVSEVLERARRAVDARLEE